MTSTQILMTLARYYIETTRPKTLPLAGASILMGASLAYWQHQCHLLITLLCLLTTLFLQILSNFANDYGDHQKGTDTSERVGPLRGIQKGKMTALQLKKAMICLVGLSFLTGGSVIAIAYQTFIDLWIFIGLGLLAIIAAITYTVGKKPYGYLGLGDLSVLLFFGLLGVCGTYYLQTHTLSLAIFLPAIATGLLATAVLNINNLRDVEQDKKAGKNTLIVRIGSKKGNYYHAMLLGLACLFYVIFALEYFHHWYSFIFLLTYPFLAKHLLFIFRHQQGIALAPMLGQMSMLALAVNLLFSLGLILNA